MNQVETLFSKIDRQLEQINNVETFRTAHALIKNAALELNHFKKERCFSVTYIHKVPNDHYDDFLKAMKIKARDATSIVPSINSCRVIEMLPLGFKREIMIGNHRATQRVWELEKENSFMILFKTEGIKFIATNELEKDEKETIFTARYLVDDHPNPKYNTPESFLELVMNPTYGNLEKLSSSGILDDKYQKIVINYLN